MMIKYINNWAVPATDTTHGAWIEENNHLVHDKYIMSKLAQYIKRGMTVVDAGAHIGTHALQYSMWVGNEGKVYCFEPNKVSFECLRINVGGLSNVSLFSRGLGSKSEQVGMATNETNYGASFLDKSGKGVEIIPLDVMDLEGCDFMKVDVEGFEPDLLIGAEKTITKYRPIMFIEINRVALERNNYTPDHVYEILRKFGYSFTNITEGEGLDGIQFDIICKPN